MDHTKKQWVDLGIHTEACMTRPETCGAVAGAISLLVKLTGDCIEDKCSVITSFIWQKTGIQITYTQFSEKLFIE